MNNYWDHQSSPKTDTQHAPGPAVPAPDFGAGNDTNARPQSPAPAPAPAAVPPVFPPYKAPAPARSTFHYHSTSPLQSEYTTYITERAPTAYALPPGPTPNPVKKLNAGIIVVCLIVSLLGGLGGSFLSDQLRLAGENIGSLDMEDHRPDVLTQPELESWSDVVDATQKSVVEIQIQLSNANRNFDNFVVEAFGSGVILTSDGYILTNNHVITGATLIKVILINETAYEATIVGTNAAQDVALLKVSAASLPPATLGNSDNIHVGDKVLAIGNPTGLLGGTVTDGIVSALDREIAVDGVTMHVMQISAAVNPGNSGGGLFNVRGELIGIVNAKTSGEGLGFAIPINAALAVVDEITGGYAVA